eukprot:403374254
MQAETQCIEEIPLQNNNVDKENLDPQLNDRFMRMLRYNSRMDKIYLDLNFSTDFIIHQLKHLNEIFPDAKFEFEQYDPSQPNHIFEVLTQSANNFHIKVDNFPDLFRLQKKENIILKFFAVTCFRKQISLDPQHPEYFEISDQHYKKIVRLFETAKCIIPISATRHFSFLLNYQSMEGVIDYLDREDEKVVVQAMFCLEKYITYSESWRNRVIQAGVISTLCQFIYDSLPSQPKFIHASWLLTMFYKLSPFPKVDSIRQAVPALNNALILIQDENATIDLLSVIEINCQTEWFKCYFLNRIQTAQTIVRRLLELTNHVNYEISIQAMRCVAFLILIAVFDEISYLTKEGAIGLMAKHLDHESIDVRILATFNLQKIVAGYKNYNDQFMISGALDKSILNFTYDRYELLKIAAVTISELSKRGQSLQQIREIIEKGVFKYLIEMQHSVEIRETFGIKAVYRLMKAFVWHFEYEIFDCSYNPMEYWQQMKDYEIKITQLVEFYELMEDQGILQYLCQCQHEYSQEVQTIVDKILSRYYGKFNKDFKEWKKRKLHHKVYYEFNNEIFNF